jgi:outer membrane autotransporter protein
MTRNVQLHRGTPSRRQPTPAIAPIARAVRHALAVSAMALSLAVPVANAATCTSPTVAAAVPCARAPGRLVLADLANVPGLLAIDDPALVAGAFAAPSPVTPRTTDLIQDGVIDVISPTGDAVGLAVSDDTVSVHNLGDIHAGGYTSAIGLDLSGTSVSLDNDGRIVGDVVNGSGGYAPAIGVRAFAEQVDLHNGTDGYLAATVLADGGRARARAIYAFGFGDLAITNDGDIVADAQADGGRAEAHGIYAFGYGTGPSVTNHGDIDSHARALGGSAYATGINSIGYASGADLAEVINTGSIHALAEGDYAYAFGVLNLTRQRNGSASLDNSGDLHAEAIGDFATATAALNLALRYGDATTVNTGAVEAIATGDSGGSATGLFTHAYVYDAIVDNQGLVDVDASGDMAIGVGIYAGAGFYGDTSVTNSGTVAVDAEGGTRFANAVGVAALAAGNVEVVNDGVIDVVANTGAGAASAAGMYGSGYLSVALRNYGDVSASAHSDGGDATAYGAFAFAGYTGIGLLINAGDITASAEAGAGGYATATAEFVTGDVASLFNDGTASATAIADGGFAEATGAYGYSAYTSIANDGTLGAIAQADDGEATAQGAESRGYFGAITTNDGAISAAATAIGGSANAAGAYTIASIFSAYTINSGDISASATGDTAVSYGVLNASTYVGDAITVNSGDIVASSVGGIAPYGEAEAIAWGVYNFALVYGSYVVNSGSILAQASALADVVPGEGFLQAKAIGAAAMNGYGAWHTGIINYGDIGAIAETSVGYASAWGAVARSGGAYGGATFVDNSGTIVAQAHSDIGVAVTIGAYIASLAGDASITNAGDIVAYSRVEMGVPELMLPDSAYATGVYIRSPYGATTLANAGSITGHVSGYGALVYAAGIQAFGETVSLDNAEGASIVALAELDRFGFAGATAVEAHGLYGVTVTNAGDVVAYASSHGWEMPGYTFLGAAGAVGIYAESSFFGDVAVTNTADVTAIAVASDNVNGPSGAAGATGINAYGKYDASVANYGDIFASATTDLGNAAAYGVMTKGKYSSHVVNGEGATIIALAQTGSQAGDEFAGRAIAFGTHTFGSDYAYTTNDGLVVAHATATADNTDNVNPPMAGAWGLSIGAYSDGIRGDIVNRGDVEAVASADLGIATAYGTNVQVSYVANTDNAGSILAMATADHGDALAVGAQVSAIHFDYYVPCTPYGCDYSNPTYTPDAGEASLVNTGTIVAAAYADGGIARSYGVGLLGGFGASMVNAGDITALTRADEAFATGVFAAAPYGPLTVDNAGTILAAAYGSDATAIGVRMESTGTNTLTNTGTIAAIGDGTRIAILSSIDAIAALANAGTISGAIVTGNLADTFDNALSATWHAVDSSDFGAGSDVVDNLGTIVLDDASVRMTGGDDTFANAGSVVVRGDSVLDLGSLFTNNGSVGFVDGAADDTLLAIGGLDGTGTIRFDVSGARQTSDWLRIDGDVAAGSVQTLDVNLLDAPTTADFLIPLVNVSGTANAGNFVLGNVGFDAHGLLALDFHLDASIDATNATDDVFALGVSVTGLNAAGSLAAAVAPGAQSLVQAQIGTWRQRTGALPAQGDKGLTPWLRLFAESGGVDMEHRANFGPDGDFAFHQSNQGFELGLETRPTQNLSLGLMLGSSEGDQHLRETGGRSHFLGRTFGLFGTWHGDGGFYVDVSQRWTGVDARLDTALGAYQTRASTSAFNVETGLQAWTLGGVHVVPQLQYTRTRIGDIDAVQVGSSVFVDDGGTSRRGRLGVAFDKSYTVGSFQLTPYGSLNVVREFEGEYDHTINGGLQGTSLATGTGSMVELGLGARRNGLTLSGSVTRADGGALEDVVGGQFTVRHSW